MQEFLGLEDRRVVGFEQIDYEGRLLAFCGFIRQQALVLPVNALVTTAQVCSVAFSDDGKYFVTAGTSLTVCALFVGFLFGFVRAILLMQPGRGGGRS